MTKLTRQRRIVRPSPPPAARARYRAPDSITKRSTLQVRVGLADLARLDAIAEALKLTRSAAVRWAIGHAGDAIKVP